MKKLLKEARKGEEDNVLSFEPVPKPEQKPPDGPDWLRSLPVNTRFLAKKKNATNQVFLELFGIGHVTPKAVLLFSEVEYGPAMIPKYVNSAAFSRMYDHVETLPVMKPLEEGDGVENGNSDDNPT